VGRVTSERAPAQQRARDLFLRTGGRNRNGRLPPLVSFYLGRNSIERLLPAEPLNIIYRGAPRSLSLPLFSLPRASSSPLCRRGALFLSRRRITILPLSLSLSLLQLQIYKVGRVTAGSFVSLVMKSGTFNILSRTEQADRPRPLALFPNATFSRLSHGETWRIRTSVNIELIFTYDEWNLCARA